VRASAVKSKSGESLCTRAAKVKREWPEHRRLATNRRQVKLSSDQRHCEV